MPKLSELIQKRMLELDAREAALNAREAALNAREAELNARSATNATKKNTSASATSAKKNMIQVIYTSNYRDSRPEHTIIGLFNTENEAAEATLKWVINNAKGGFDVDILQCLFNDMNNDDDAAILGLTPQSSRPTNLRTKQDFINYYMRNGMTWSKMRDVFENDGDSYFGDEDGVGGWDIIKNVIKA